MDPPRFVLCFVLAAVLAAQAHAGGVQTPLYSRTLAVAVEDLKTPVIVAGEEPVSPQAPRGVRVTSQPGFQTVCSGPKTIICTTVPWSSTRCQQQSATACTDDPACGATTRPANTVTLCRGDHTNCSSGVPNVCTALPQGFTHCTPSGTSCPNTDPICYTYRPQGGETICPEMQTACWFNQPVFCTKDPWSTTVCENSSGTWCPSDPNCWLPPVELAYIEPSVGAPGELISGFLGFSGDMNDLITGEMSVCMGEFIEVYDVEVISPVEAYIEIAVSPMAPPGTYDVFLRGGDAESPTGEHVVNVGRFTVENGSYVEPTESSWGKIKNTFRQVLDLE